MNRIVVDAIGYNAADTEAWSAYVAAHRDATTYHTLSWRTVFEQGLGYRSWLLMARDDTDGRVVGVLPLYRVATPLSSRLVSVPFRDRGGPLWSTEEALDALITQAKKLLASTGGTYLQMKSLHRWPVPAVQRNGLAEAMHWMHSVVPLHDMDAKGLWKRIGDKTRNMVRQAEAGGLTFVDMTHAPSASDDWFRLHLLTQKRLGVPPFPRRFFELMIQELGRNGAIRVYCVNKEDTPLAAMLLLCHRDVAIYGYSASSVEAQRLRANDLMLYRTMCELTEGKYACFDMGSDAPNQNSLLFFKRKWGAVQHQIPGYFYGDGQVAIIDSSAPRYALARKVFSSLPLSVSAFAGRYLTRCFG